MFDEIFFGRSVVGMYLISTVPGYLVICLFFPNIAKLGQSS